MLRALRKLYPALVIAFTVCMLLFVGAFSARGGRVKLAPEREYFFVVRECESTASAAVAGQVYGSGGAGYVLGGEGVAVACYFGRDDADSVCAALRRRGESVSVLARRTGTLVLEEETSDFAEEILLHLETAESCARLLFRTANGLERGETGQTEARAVLRGAADSLAGLADSRLGETFGRWGFELNSVSRACASLSSALVFSKDLRKLQVRLCLAVSSYGEYFG